MRYIAVVLVLLAAVGCDDQSHVGVWNTTAIPAGMYPANVRSVAVEIRDDKVFVTRLQDAKGNLLAESTGLWAATGTSNVISLTTPHGETSTASFDGSESNTMLVGEGDHLLKLTRSK